MFIKGFGDSYLGIRIARVDSSCCKGGIDRILPGQINGHLVVFCVGELRVGLSALLVCAAMLEGSMQVSCLLNSLIQKMHSPPQHSSCGSLKNEDLVKARVSTL